VVLVPGGAFVLVVPVTAARGPKVHFLLAPPASFSGRRGAICGRQGRTLVQENGLIDLVHEGVGVTRYLDTGKRRITVPTNAHPLPSSAGPVDLLSDALLAGSVKSRTTMATRAVRA
jgi:hypothetical protein